MSSGNNNNGNNVDWTRVASPELEGKPTDSIQVQIAKFDEQSWRQRDRLMKQAAEQEARRLAEEAARKKAEEESDETDGENEESGNEDREGESE